MAHGEIHLELSVNYADDDKLRRLASYGRRARGLRDLYVQMLCYCKRNMSDGEVPAEQIGLLVYPDSLKDGLRDAELLIAVGLVEKNSDSFYVPGYLKRNKSRQQITAEANAKQAGAVLGNHNRWHGAKPDLRCPHCRDSAPIATPITTGVSTANGGLTRCESTETETETETVATESQPRRPKGIKTGPPDVFPISDSMAEWGRANAPLVTDPHAETRQFLDHARANGKTFIDWTAAWRTWMSNAQKYATQRPSNIRAIGSKQMPPGTSPHLAHLYEQS